MAKYVDATPNASGAYPNAKNQPFPGCIPLTEEQASIFRQYNGFVTITSVTDEHGAVSYTVEANQTAWENWKAALPEESESSTSLPDRVSTLETDTAELQEALDMILSGVTE